MTPKELADKYPAQWQVYKDRITLRIGSCGFTVYADCPIDTQSVVCDAPMSRDQDQDDRVSFESVPDAIGYLLAREIVRDPGAVDLYKIPDWAKESTGKALETHKQRIQDVQTHIEWSKK